MNKDQLRTSQLITTFGPGAMVDLPDASVIVGGLDHWNYDPSHIPTINEERLTAKMRLVLGRNTLMLRQPPPASDVPQGFHPDIVGWRFPEWFVVQEKDDPGQRERSRRLIHRKALDAKGL